MPRIKFGNLFEYLYTSEDIFTTENLREVSGLVELFSKGLLEFRDFKDFSEKDARELVRNYGYTLSNPYCRKTFDDENIERLIEQDLRELEREYTGQVLENYRKLLIELKKIELVLRGRKRAKFFVNLMSQSGIGFQFFLDYFTPFFFSKKGIRVIPSTFFVSNIQVIEKKDINARDFDLTNIEWKNDEKDIAIVRFRDGIVIVDRRVRGGVRLFTIGGIKIDGATHLGELGEINDGKIRNFIIDDKWKDDEDIKKILTLFVNYVHKFAIHYDLKENRIKIVFTLDQVDNFGRYIGEGIGKFQFSVKVDWDMLDREGITEENLCKLFEVDGDDTYVEFDKRYDERIREQFSIPKGEVDLLKDVFRPNSLSYIVRTKSGKPIIYLPPRLDVRYIDSLESALRKTPSGTRVKLVSNCGKIYDGFSEVVEMPNAEVHLVLPKSPDRTYVRSLIKSVKEVVEDAGGIKVQFMGCDRDIQRIFGKIASLKLEGVEIEIIVDSSDTQPDVDRMKARVEQLEGPQKERVKFDCRKVGATSWQSSLFKSAGGRKRTLHRLPSRISPRVS